MGLGRPDKADVMAAAMLVGLACSLFVGPGSSLVQAQTQNDRLIVPRERIGGAALRKTTAELIDALGDPVSV